MTDHDAEMDAIVAMLEDAGLVESYTNEDGKPALRASPLAAHGTGRAMAMGGEDADPDAVLAALLDDAPDASL